MTRRRMTDLHNRPPRFRVTTSWADVKTAFIVGNCTGMGILYWILHSSGKV